MVKIDGIFPLGEIDSADLVLAHSRGFNFIYKRWSFKCKKQKDVKFAEMQLQKTQKAVRRVVRKIKNQFICEYGS